MADAFHQPTSPLRALSSPKSSTMGNAMAGVAGSTRFISRSTCTKLANPTSRI
ncbi:hypothetical protein M404DRAFT_1008597 [Pisolithus tinctorius Marx 270]|uniref:Uncharacterized protein n=1 Tax=Pisolithus tinctorius Marx 270 TaxID=870435 RepID=A0A0C3NF06_PISTI|nr:hypothetical protein M404DRAFT_1008597 [Pisolithus tinctorius Marx 270]